MKLMTFEEAKEYAEQSLEGETLSEYQGVTPGAKGRYYKRPNDGVVVRIVRCPQGEVVVWTLYPTRGDRGIPTYCLASAWVRSPEVEVECPRCSKVMVAQTDYLCEECRNYVILCLGA